MLGCRSMVLGMLWLTLAGPALAQQPAERPPDPALVRNEVNKVLGIYADPKPAPTLGRIVDVANLSIAFGAPTYNAGDIAGCRSFYQRSMEDVLDLWGKEAADPLTTEAVGVLREAVERTKSFKNEDRQAWALRFGWDRVALLHATELMEIRGLLALGEQSMARSHYPEAASAYSAAAQKIDAVVGTEPRTIEVELRFASIAEGHARLGLGDYPGAARAVARGLALIPEWLTYEVDRAEHHPAGEYDTLLAALEGAAKASPEQAELQFLLAYEYAMVGRKKEAEKLLKGVLKADEDHAGARILSGALATR